MAALEEIISELDSLTADSMAELARFVEYLKWKQGPRPGVVSAQPWSYDFVEYFRETAVTADQDPAGMEVRVGEAACANDWRMALWQHPPVRGQAIVEYQVPVPATVTGPRLSFATGIRDGSQLAEGNVVAFRIFVDNWRIWSDTQRLRKWRSHEVALPTLPGDIIRIRFVTDGLGNHEWAWAVWGEPKLLAEVTG